MKKTLVTLAVLAATGAASAQVTVYGRADFWVGNLTNETAAGAVVTSLSRTRLDSGGVTTPRIGFKGTEDLGGGLAANFDFQQGISIDTGAGRDAATVFTPVVAPAVAPVAAFGRQAWVGLSGDFGATRFGLTTTPFDDQTGTSHALWDSALNPVNGGAATGNGVFRSTSTGAYTARPGNTIFYQSPKFGGLTGAISYSLGENNTAAVGAGSVTSFALTYGAGPLAAELAYQTEEAALANVAPQVSTDYTRLGGSYDFGAAKLMASYGKVNGIGRLAGAEATEYQVGAHVPFGALTLGASYASSQDSLTAGDAKRTGFGLGAKYDLSKRTYGYGGYKAVTLTVPGAADTKDSLLAVGMVHLF